MKLKEAHEKSKPLERLKHVSGLTIPRQETLFKTICQMSRRKYAETNDDGWAIAQPAKSPGRG
ncbi:MAG: hypothetical protein LBQ00_06725 [Syntrophobacterales bacterium]|jgi:hypothetical protein|nr:hypothetical protein [Syntrophobacterales bacterium]